MKNKRFVFIGLIITLSIQFPLQQVHADIWGGDVAVLVQILAETFVEISKMEQLIGKSSQTVNILEDMNRGAKDVLRLSRTAHAPLPPGIYAQAKTLDQAVAEARRQYGGLGDRSPTFTQSHYRSGAEGLSLSQDAFDYSTFLDDQGERIKASAVVANQSAATKLTAESSGVLIQSVDQGNRLQAKQLELSSTTHIEDSSKEGARFNSFIDTNEHIDKTLKSGKISSLNEIPF